MTRDDDVNDIIATTEKLEDSRIETSKESTTTEETLNSKPTIDFETYETRHANKKNTFEYELTGTLEDKVDFRLFVLGVRRGNACLDRASTIMSSDDQRYHFTINKYETIEDVARLIAKKRGYTDIGSDRGMTNIVDGADPLFDQRRAVFLLGVEEGIHGADPEQIVYVLKKPFKSHLHSKA